MLRNYPQYDLNVQQEAAILYDGVNVTTRKHLDFQGPMKSKEPGTIKELINEFSKHSREYHTPREDVTRLRGNLDRGNEHMAAILEKLESIDRRLTKMDKSIHSIRVGCDSCGSPHFT